MTREEALKLLKTDGLARNEAEADRFCEAFDMAIKALENHDTFMKYAYSQGKQDALSQEQTVTSTDEPITIIYPTIVCDEAISREAVKELIKSGVSTDTYDDVEQVCKWIDALPSVTQKSGKWIGIDEEPHEDYECNKCGYIISTYTANIEPHTEYKYCPNCGAKMENEDKEC